MDEKLTEIVHPEKKLVPLGKRVIVEPIQEKESLLIDRVTDPEPSKGTVLRVGLDVTKVTEGEVVLFKMYAGTVMDDLLIFNEDDLFGVWR